MQSLVISSGFHLCCRFTYIGHTNSSHSSSGASAMQGKVHDCCGEGSYISISRLDWILPVITRELCIGNSKYRQNHTNRAHLRTHICIHIGQRLSRLVHKTVCKVLFYAFHCQAYSGSDGRRSSRSGYLCYLQMGHSCHGI